MEAQVLDSMDLERERGITIKAQSVSLQYQSNDGQTYLLNFIDTPGHVDFSYEVSRSLAACEGALLVVDAAQGVEAQSVANCNNAINQGLEVIPVLNKIDLPAAEPERVRAEIEDIIGIDSSDAIHVSAKTGDGIPELLEQLVRRIPPPVGRTEGALKALIIDSWFDNYLGVVSLVRVFEGQLKTRQRITVMSTGRECQIDELGIFTPKRVKKDSIRSGEVGYLVAGIKDIDGAPVGDTVTDTKHPAVTALPGFQKSKPNVFAGLYPIDSAQYEAFRDALARLRLNDAALQYEPETSQALGFGFRCGFLGMLHMEIVQQRLEREYANRTHHHSAHGRLRSRHVRWKGHADRQSRAVARAEPDRRDPRARHHNRHSRSAGTPRQRDRVVHRKAWGLNASFISSVVRWQSATTCRWRRWSPISSIA